MAAIRRTTAGGLAVWLLISGGAVAGPPTIPAPPVIGAKSYMLVDSNSGFELASLAPDRKLAPASLTKLMSAYTVFRAIDEGELYLDEAVTVSETAWRMPGSRMFIEVGSRISVRDLILGMLVQSGNDASVALAEHVAGSEAIFAGVMNRYADELGMDSSHFVNATGLPAADHYSTARDLAVLARAIIDEFPEYYDWYSVREYTWNDISQRNRNRLLWSDAGVDGMKTGHTDAAGYCLVSSAQRDGMRIVSVVLGMATPRSRNEGTQALLDYGFRFFETRLLFRAGETVAEARVWKAADEFTPLGLSEDLYITVPRGSYDGLKSVLQMPAILLAPVAEGQPLAELQVSLDGAELINQPLQALSGNPAGSIWQRTRDGVMLWFE